MPLLILLTCVLSQLSLISLFYIVWLKERSYFKCTYRSLNTTSSPCYRGFAKRTLMKTAKKAGFKPKDSATSKRQKYVLPTPPLARKTLAVTGLHSSDRPASGSYDEDLSGECSACCTNLFGDSCMFGWWCFCVLIAARLQKICILHNSEFGNSLDYENTGSIDLTKP